MNSPVPVAAICSVLYIGGYWFTLSEGTKAYTIFVPRVDVTVDKDLKGDISYRC